MYYGEMSVREVMDTDSGGKHCVDRDNKNDNFRRPNQSSVKVLINNKDDPDTVVQCVTKFYNLMIDSPNGDLLDSSCESVTSRNNSKKDMHSNGDSTSSRNSIGLDDTIVMSENEVSSKSISNNSTLIMTDDTSARKSIEQSHDRVDADVNEHNSTSDDDNDKPEVSTSPRQRSSLSPPPSVRNTPSPIQPLEDSEINDDEVIYECTKPVKNVVLTHIDLATDSESDHTEFESDAESPVLAPVVPKVEVKERLKKNDFYTVTAAIPSTSYAKTSPDESKKEREQWIRKGEVPDSIVEKDAKQMQSGKKQASEISDKEPFNSKKKKVQKKKRQIRRASDKNDLKNKKIKHTGTESIVINPYCPIKSVKGHDNNSRPNEKDLSAHGKLTGQFRIFELIPKPASPVKDGPVTIIRRRAHQTLPPSSDSDEDDVPSRSPLSKGLMEKHENKLSSPRQETDEANVNLPSCSNGTRHRAHKRTLRENHVNMQTDSNEDLKRKRKKKSPSPYMSSDDENSENSSSHSSTKLTVKHKEKLGSLRKNHEDHENIISDSDEEVQRKNRTKSSLPRISSDDENSENSSSHSSKKLTVKHKKKSTSPRKGHENNTNMISDSEEEVQRKRRKKSPSPSDKSEHEEVDPYEMPEYDPLTDVRWMFGYPANENWQAKEAQFVEKLRKRQMNVLPRVSYARWESQGILWYLIKNGLVRRGLGRKPWELMRHDGFLLHRTEKSLASHFRGPLLKNIKSFGIPKNILQLFEFER